MRLFVIGMFLSVVDLHAASKFAAVEGPVDWAQTGRSRFEQCEFRDAARAFTKALQFRPDDAGLHFWLGRSYARMAEVAGPFHAAGNARQAQRNLERAVALQPRDHMYLRELFDFYLDSPEWFTGGLDRAALLVVRIAPDDRGEQAFLRVLLDDARNEYRGSEWRLRQATLLPASQMGRVVP